MIIMDVIVQVQHTIVYMIVDQVHVHQIHNEQAWV